MSEPTALERHLSQGVVGLPTALASAVGLIMASPVILTATTGFGNGGGVFAIAVAIAFLLTVFAITTRIGTDLLETLTAMLNPLPAIALLPLLREAHSF